MKPMKFPRRKQKRQEEAALRQGKWSELPLEAKLAVVRSREGQAAKQTAKLEAQLAKAKDKQ